MKACFAFHYMAYMADKSNAANTKQKFNKLSFSQTDEWMCFNVSVISKQFCQCVSIVFQCFCCSEMPT